MGIEPRDHDRAGRNPGGHVDCSKYKRHSFRIGAATFAAGSNVSDARIRALDRWSSNAFRKYICISGTNLALWPLMFVNDTLANNSLNSLNV